MEVFDQNPVSKPDMEKPHNSIMSLRCEAETSGSLEANGSNDPRIGLSEALSASE